MSIVELDRVSDTPLEGTLRRPLLRNVTCTLEPRRYAILSPHLYQRKHLIDLLAGLRPPRAGNIHISGRRSWPIGRAGFARGFVTGLQVVHFVARLYDLQVHTCLGILEDVLSEPDHLHEPLQFWSGNTRAEFGHAVGLLPEFDIYYLDGGLPAEKSRFTRIWQDLFDLRTYGKPLFLSSARVNDLKATCDCALVLDDERLEVMDDLSEALALFPARPAFKERDDGDQGFDMEAHDIL